MACHARLVLVILFLFLLNFRTTFITLTAIPLSLVITTLVFRLLSVVAGTELSINVLTLGGIAAFPRAANRLSIRSLPGVSPPPSAPAAPSPPS